MAEPILVERDAHLVTITLNRPEKRNALTGSMVATLRETFGRVGGDESVRVVVLRGNGPAFCAGLDLKEMAEQRAAAGEAQMGGLEEALEDLEHCPHPTIAVVQGDAIAGGCELALHCDLRVAGDSARFAMPLARIGLAVPVTLTWKLVDAIGAAKTCELLFGGEAVSAETARALGLVNRVVPDEELRDAALGVARQIAQNAPLGVRAMKAFVQRAGTLTRGLPRDDLEAMHRRIRQSHDVQEGLAAQRERRAPRFRGE
jgi:enoyl-CoA hydratase/carnithine racemase